MIRQEKSTQKRKSSNSDHLTMDPNQTCEFILNQIKTSNLNYTLTETPFAVTLNIKKSFIKEKSGSVRSSGVSSTNFEQMPSITSFTTSQTKNAMKTQSTKNCYAQSMSYHTGQSVNNLTAQSVNTTITWPWPSQ